MEWTARLRAEGRPEAAFRAVRPDRGKEEMDRIRQVMAEMQAEGGWLLQEREVELKR
jgi:CHASE3 domain sensor protein